jgi:hypothetical protein
MFCPYCNSNKIKKNGNGHSSKQHYLCNSCKKRFTDDTPVNQKYTFRTEGDSAELSALTDKRITSLKDLIDVCKIDTQEWIVERWTCNAWETSSKWRDQDLTWTKGTGVKGEDTQIMEGYAKRENKWIKTTNFQVKAWLKRNSPLIEARDYRDIIISEIKKHKPKYNKPVYKKNKEPYLYEINPTDLHYGKHTWGKETGEDYDIDIAEVELNKCIDEHIQTALLYNIDKFLFVVGNDFFNVDNKANTTAAGTPQQEDTRWKKTFSKGLKLLVNVIDKLRAIAQVDIIIIPGNHDLERIYYLGIALDAWYRTVDGVSVDNTPSNRKYYSYGKCLIGFTHGKDEKLKDLPTVMSIETPNLWAKSKYREWHLGDKHHQKSIDTISIEENQGVTIRILRSISPADQWHHSKGYIGSLKSVEGFLWHKEKGMVNHIFSNL